jgi:hypothetical protein
LFGYTALSETYNKHSESVTVMRLSTAWRLLGYGGKLHTFLTEVSRQLHVPVFTALETSRRAVFEKVDEA